jgi:aryl-alcohol dehydrogenase-like predicted oxidoreductase
MQYRRLGTSDLNVSEIALGSWLTYGNGVERRRAIDCVHRALALGVNLIDTANIYNFGEAETLLGEALATVPRDSYVLATKLYFPMTPQDRGLSRAQVHKQLDASLARLRTDHVDLYQCHRFDADTPLEETLAALTEVVRAGKVRYIGFSEWPVAGIRRAREVPDVEHFVSSQPQYSLLWRAPEAEVIPECRRQGISQIVWSPLAQGLLTGKYRPGSPPPADSRAANERMNAFMDASTLERRRLEAIDAYRRIAEAQRCTPAQFALAWVLREPNVAAAIIGASRPDQVDENVVASGLKIDPAAFAAAERLLAPVAKG